MAFRELTHGKMGADSDSGLEKKKRIYGEDCFVEWRWMMLQNPGGNKLL